MVEKTKSTGAGAKSAKKSAPSKTLTSKAAGSAGKQAKAAKKPAKPGKAGTVFSLDAPRAGEAYVAGSFNDWAIVPLSRNPMGIWTCTIQLEPGEYEYRFLVDGEWWDDPMNEMRRGNEFGTHNCILTISE